MMVSPLGLNAARPVVSRPDILKSGVAVATGRNSIRNKARGRNRPGGTQGLGAGRSAATTRALVRHAAGCSLQATSTRLPKQTISGSGGQFRPSAGEVAIMGWGSLDACRRYGTSKLTTDPQAKHQAHARRSQPYERAPEERETSPQACWKMGIQKRHRRPPDLFVSASMRSRSKQVCVIAALPCCQLANKDGDPRPQSKIVRAQVGSLVDRDSFK
jgi:hypothetical protein